MKITFLFSFLIPNATIENFAFLNTSSYTNFTLHFRKQFQSLQWLIPTLQQRKILNKVKECNNWLLKRYYKMNSAIFHVKPLFIKVSNICFSPGGEYFHGYETDDMEDTLNQVKFNEERVSQPVGDESKQTSVIRLT